MDLGRLTNRGFSAGLVLAVLMSAGCAHVVEPGEGRGTGFWSDGGFGEWDAVARLAADGGDVDSPDALDLVSLSMADEPRFVHLLLEVDRVVNAQGMPGSIEIVIDADGDQSSGVVVDGMDGMDLVVVLSRPADDWPPGEDLQNVGFGVAVRVVEEGALGPLETASRVGLLVSPTHSSNRFEIRLRRGSAIGGGIVLAKDRGLDLRGAVRYVRDAVPVDRMGPFVHRIGTPLESADPFLPAERITQGDGTFRLVVWNVSDDAFSEQSAAFGRVLTALRPQVILLDEVYEEVTSDELRGFLARVGSTPGRTWTWALATGGGPQRTVVASRDFPVSAEPALRRIEYDRAELAMWADAAGGSAGVRAKHDVEEAGGLSATGAWVEVDGVPILFVPLDLQSRGHDGSPEDQLRELQSRTLNRALSDLLASRPEVGLVVAGDLNLVGSERPRSVLVRGLGPTGDDLAVAEPLNWVDRSLTTWRSTGNADDFSPGRLDHVLYRAQVLDVENAFVFDVAHYSPADRRRLGLEMDDTWKTSDHLPLVVDFRVLANQ